VLLTIACLSLGNRLSRSALAHGRANFRKMLTVEMMFSFYFGIYSGTMLGALVEIVPAHVRTTCFSMLLRWLRACSEHSRRSLRPG